MGKTEIDILSPHFAGRYWLYTRCVRISKHEVLRYEVHHDGGVSDVYIDQLNYGGEWQVLGTFDLTPGMGHRVYLNANQPIRSITEVCADAVAAIEDLNGPRRVVADAMKFVPNTAEAALTVHADHLGSPQKMTDPAGAVVWDASYKPFGEEAAISGASTNNQRFPGQYFDAETSLHYNWMRDYDASIGRYVQSDPIGLRGGANTYEYAVGNPVQFTDIQGLRIDWGNFVLRNPLVRENLQKVNDELINMFGLKDECFVLRVTGGDRYRDPVRGPNVHRSSTTHGVEGGSSRTSPHLVERGARAVDVVAEDEVGKVCNCKRRLYNFMVMWTAIWKTDFNQASDAYVKHPHIHLALPYTHWYSYQER